MQRVIFMERSFGSLGIAGCVALVYGRFIMQQAFCSNLFQIDIKQVLNYRGAQKLRKPISIEVYLRNTVSYIYELAVRLIETLKLNEMI